MSHWLRRKRWHFHKRVTSQPNPTSFKWSHSAKLHSILICVTLATMETVAFPKESDIATKHNLVHMVPLCQIALDPHLCLIGYDGNGGISKREGHRNQTQSRSNGPTLSNCTRSSSVSHGLRWKRWHFQQRVTSQPKPVSCKWSHPLKLQSILTMETVAFPKESDIAAQTKSRSSGPTLSNCARSSSVSHWKQETVAFPKESDIAA